MRRRPLLRASAAVLAASLFPGARSARSAQGGAAQDGAAKSARGKKAQPVPSKPAPALQGLAASSGPGITSEVDLLRDYPGAIAQFWNTGEPGEFLSTRGEAVPIRLRRFPRPGADTAIVLSAGRTECLIKYKELIYDLNRNGYAVFIHDHRGQGFSGRLLADPMIGHVEAFDDYVADLKTFVDEQVKPAGYKRHILLGHSMGGCIAALYLEQHQRDFDRAVLSSPMFEPNLPAQEASVFAVSALDAIGLGDRMIPGGHDYDHRRDFDAAANEYIHSRTRWEITWDEFNANPGAKLGSPSLHWVRSAYAAGRQAQNQAARIVVPVLLLQAGDDSIVVAGAQNRFAARLNYAHPDSCTLVRIDDARHELLVEADSFRTPALERIFGFIVA